MRFLLAITAILGASSTLALENPHKRVAKYKRSAVTPRKALSRGSTPSYLTEKTERKAMCYN